jgi:hypothetical protein
MGHAATCPTYPGVLTGLYHHDVMAPVTRWRFHYHSGHSCHPFVTGHISVTCFISDSHPVTDARREFRIELLPWLTTKGFVLSCAKVATPRQPCPLLLWIGHLSLGVTLHRPSSVPRSLGLR